MHFIMWMWKSWSRNQNIIIFTWSFFFLYSDNMKVQGHITIRKTSYRHNYFELMNLRNKFYTLFSNWNRICRLTCIYAACKAEENHVSAEELGKGIEQDHQVILNNEMLVLQARVLIRVSFLNLVSLLFQMSWQHITFFAESGIWSYCLCTLSCTWWFCQWCWGLFWILLLVLMHYKLLASEILLCF